MIKRIALLTAAICFVTWGSIAAPGSACGQGPEASPAAQSTSDSPKLSLEPASQPTPAHTAAADQSTTSVPADAPPTDQTKPVDVAAAKPEQVYKSLDLDGDEVLTLVEFRGGKRNVDAVEAEHQFKLWDTDQNDKLTFQEYTAGLAAASPWYKAWYSVLGIAVLVVLLSVAFGTWMGPLVRLPEASWKFTIVALALLTALTLMWLRWPPKLGIDLNGGTILAYEFDKSDRGALPAGVTKDLMARMIAAITKRVDPAGVKLVTIRSIGPEEIEVIVPEVDPTEVAMLKQILRTQGHLEFRILADKEADADVVERAKLVDWKVEDPSSDALRDSSEDIVKYLIQEAEGLEKARLAAAAGAKGEQAPPDMVIMHAGRAAAEWVNVPAKDATAASENKNLVTRTIDGKLQKLIILGQLHARWVPVGRNESGAPRIGGPEVIWRPSRTGQGTDVLVMMDMQNVEGKYLKQARVNSDSIQRAVDFEFNAEGARLFGTLTGDNVPRGNLTRKLGIILDDELLSAPQLRSRIAERGQITGDFSKKEVDWLVGVLDRGSLPARLNPTPISEMRADATLGEETIRQGALAILISIIIVPLAMIAYYRFAGLVAGVAVLLNLVLVVAVMVGVQAAFTLAGLAGLVLTVGMSVDANVLIFERIREELERGAALRMAIRNGFSRATRTIVDSNATNIITAVVLYTVGTEQLKGFAVTLILGILISMFTAIFCARLVLDVCEKNRWITTLRMTKMIGITHVDFVGAMRYCLAGMAALILIGMVAVYMRGGDFLDIDFRGGAKIEVVFNGPQQQKAVEDQLKKYNDDPAISNDKKLDAVTATGVGLRTPEGNTSFHIETVQSNSKVVQATIKDVFKDKLKTNRLTFDRNGLKTIAAATGVTTPAGGNQPGAVKTNAEKPESDNPGAAKPAAPAKEKPASNGAQSSVRQSRSPVAFWDPQVLFLAQVNPAGKNADSAPAASQPTGPSEPATQSPPAAQPTGAAAPPVKASVPLPGEEPLERQPSNPFSGGTMVDLKFDQSIKQEVLSELIRQAGRAAGLVKAAEVATAKAAGAPEAPDQRPLDLNFQFQVSNPEVIGDSQLPKNTWTLKTSLNQPDTLKLLANLETQMAAEPYFPLTVNVGDQVAGVMQRSAFVSIIVSFMAIIGYLWLRFQHARYGLAAVVALIHDVLITVGILALTEYFTFIPYIEGFKMNLVILAAILTLIGYSLNDTIVIFDRIRELRGKSPHITKALVNDAINQTLSRTLLTSALTFVVVGVLFFVGGPGVHGFAFTLLIGIIVGTYSSIYVAAPVLLWMEGSAADAPRPQRGPERAATPTAG